MANAAYNALINGIMNGSIDLDTDTFHAVMVDSGYTYSAAHATMENANVPTANRVGYPATTAVASPSVASQAWDGNDVTFSSVASGTVDAIIVYKYVTSETNASSIPCLYVDTTSDASLPVTANGGDITIAWNASGLMTIA